MSSSHGRTSFKSMTKRVSIDLLSSQLDFPHPGKVLGYLQQPLTTFLPEIFFPKNKILIYLLEGFDKVP